MALIYCVEDDDGIRELITCALATGGYEVVAFDSSKKLYEKIGKQRPVLILLDIMLPGEDGVSILKRIKSNPDSKDIPVIMLTAKSSEIDKVVALEAGADDYVTKPFGIMELLSRIKAVLRRTNRDSENEGEVLSHNGIVINQLNRTVSCNEKLITLTFKEYELLWYLIKNKGIVLTREKIMAKVWGYDFEGESRTVDMHIKTLRQKLVEADMTDYIKTVRGVGYSV